MIKETLIKNNGHKLKVEQRKKIMEKFLSISFFSKCLFFIKCLIRPTADELRQSMIPLLEDRNQTSAQF